MARYLDNWVFHKTIYDVMVQGGSCVCVTCILNTTCSTTFLPTSYMSFDSLLQNVKDMEAQDVEGETTFYTSQFQSSATSTLDSSNISEDFWRAVWMDRIQVRLRLEKSQYIYSQLFSSFFHDATLPNTHEEDYRIHALYEWFQQYWTIEELETFFQISHFQVLQLLRDQYKLVEKNYLDIFLPSILQQMENFHLTRYPLDSRGKEEIEFEQVLETTSSYFFLPVATCSMIPQQDKEQDGNSSIIASSMVLQTKMIETTTILVFIKMMLRLERPILLEKGHDSIYIQRMDPYPSFRYDRRMIRLIIVRHWADGIIERWKKHNSF